MSIVDHKNGDGFTSEAKEGGETPTKTPMKEDPSRDHASGNNQHENRESFVKHHANAPATENAKPSTFDQQHNAPMRSLNYEQDD